MIDGVLPFMEPPGIDGGPPAKTRDLARTIIGTFRGDPKDGLIKRLAGFTPADWSSGYGWLDTSGLELYFLERINALGIAEGVPAEAHVGMEQNFTHNRIRTAKLFDEFVRINEAFRREHLSYCNVTGISLAPISCPDLTLRRQLTMDFIMSADDSNRCEGVLAGCGYLTQSLNEQFREFRFIRDISPPDAGIYMSIAPRSVGVYFVSADKVGAERAPYDMLMRRRMQTWNGYKFPALTQCDHFIAQAIRMFGHIGVEWNRLAFLLEFRTCVHFWMHDKAFWKDVEIRAEEHPLRPAAIATATWLAAEIFGGTIPAPIQDWAACKLDPGVRTWSELYGWEALLADFPGETLLAHLHDLLEPNASFSEL